MDHRYQVSLQQLIQKQVSLKKQTLFFVLFATPQPENIFCIISKLLSIETEKESRSFTIRMRIFTFGLYYVYFTTYYSEISFSNILDIYKYYLQKLDIDFTNGINFHSSNPIEHSYFRIQNIKSETIEMINQTKKKQEKPKMPISSYRFFKPSQLKKGSQILMHNEIQTSIREYLKLLSLKDFGMDLSKKQRSLHRFHKMTVQSTEFGLFNFELTDLINKYVSMEKKYSIKQQLKLKKQIKQNIECIGPIIRQQDLLVKNILQFISEIPSYFEAFLEQIENGIHIPDENTIMDICIVRYLRARRKQLRISIHNRSSVRKGSQFFKDINSSRKRLNIFADNFDSNSINGTGRHLSNSIKMFRDNLFQFNEKLNGGKQNLKPSVLEEFHSKKLVDNDEQIHYYLQQCLKNQYDYEDDDFDYKVEQLKAKLDEQIRKKQVGKKKTSKEQQESTDFIKQWIIEIELSEQLYLQKYQKNQ